MRAIIDDVDIADVPDSAGTSRNYRAAGGASLRHTRVLTATLRTVTDGCDRLLPVVAFSSIANDDDNADLTNAAAITFAADDSSKASSSSSTTTSARTSSSSHLVPSSSSSGPPTSVEVIDNERLRFTPRLPCRHYQGEHYHQQQQQQGRRQGRAPPRGIGGSLWEITQQKGNHRQQGRAEYESSSGAEMASQNQTRMEDSCTEPPALYRLSLCHEYLCNSLRPGRHRDVIRQRRQRTVTTVKGSIRHRPANGVDVYGNIDDDVPSTAALAAAAMRRATFGSDHRGHGRMSDYYHDDDTDYQLHPNYAPRYAQPTPVIDTLEKLDACYYGYEVSDPPTPLAPPPLTRLRIDPPQVEGLISELAKVCTSVYVTVSVTNNDNAISSSATAASRPPYYRVRVYGKWPKHNSVKDGGAMVCEIELKLDGWLREDELEQKRRRRRRRVVRVAADDSCGGNGCSSRGETRGIEDIVALCVALKHDVPIYISRDVLDRFSLHPFGWQSSFHPRHVGTSSENERRRGRKRKEINENLESQSGFFHTPSDSDPHDPGLFDTFLKDLADEIDRPASSINMPSTGDGGGRGAGGGDRFRFAGSEGVKNKGNGNNIVAGGCGASSSTVSRLTMFLLLGPVAFFCLAIRFWKTWQRRWHGFTSPPPSLATQTGKHGVLAQAAMRRSLGRIAAAPERRVFDSTIAEQAQLAVLLRRLRHLEVAMSDPVNAHVNLAATMAEEDSREEQEQKSRRNQSRGCHGRMGGGNDRAARSLLAEMGRRVTGATAAAAAAKNASMPWWSGDKDDNADTGIVFSEIDVRVEAMRANYAETARALAKVQRDIDHKSCPPSRLRSLRQGESPSEAMTKAQLAAMSEDWTHCGAWIEWLSDRNVRCIDHDVVYVPWTTQDGAEEDDEEEEVGPRDRDGGREEGGMQGENKMTRTVDGEEK